MKVFIRFFSLFLLVYSVGFSQVNLISNPGFESYNTCPNFGAEINYCNNWNNVNLVYGVYTVGTPDYFNTCSTVNCQPPNTFAGQCNPHSGNAMIATVMYDAPVSNYREYFSTQLTCPMSTGSTYTVSFWLTNGLNPISPYIIKNIGACFSTNPLTQSGWNLINATPQIELTTLIGNTSWVQYTFTVVPTANWQYVTFGSFRTDLQNTPTSTYSITTGNPSVYANYFWDDISVIGPPGGSLSITTSNTNNLCNGDANASASVAVGGGGPYNYSWSPGGYTTSSVNNLSAGIYTVSVSDGVCNSNTVSITITDPPPLTTNITAGTYTICKNTSINLAASNNGGTPGYTPHWSTGANTNSIVVTPSVTSIYTYTVSDANNCKQTTSTQINIESTTADFSNSSPLCGSITTFTNSSINGNSFIWEFGDGNSSNSSPFTSHSYSASGIYTVTLISSSPIGCKDSIKKTISVNGNFQTTVSTTGTLCTGASIVNATVTAVGNGTYSYLWSPGGYTTSVVNNLSAGIYTVSVSNGTCTSNTIVTVNSTAPVINIPNGYTSCNSVCLNLTNIPYNTLSNWQWNFGDGSVLTAQKPDYCYTKPGTYHVVFTYTTTFGCVNTVTSNNAVTVLPSPTAAFLASTFDTDIFNANINFYNESSGNTSSQWLFGDLTSSSLQNPSHTFLSIGNYSVELIVKNQAGCADTVSHEVVINDMYTFYAPNTFTPNQDNFNEVFLPVGTGWDNSNFKMWVFDRWGNLILTTVNPNQGWDGKVKGQFAQEDTYVWRVELKDVYKKSHAYSGIVSIIK